MLNLLKELANKVDDVATTKARTPEAEQHSPELEVIGNLDHRKVKPVWKPIAQTMTAPTMNTMSGTG